MKTVVRIRTNKPTSEDKINKQAGIPAVLLLNRHLITLFKRLAKETAFEKIYLVGNSDNNTIELRPEVEGPAILKFTEECAKIDVNKRPSLRIQKAVGEVCNDFKFGDFDFLCQHVRLQVINLDWYRSPLTKLRVRLRLRLKNKKAMLNT